MERTRSPAVRVRAFGPLACFTRPELKVERVSYPVMTPSAARGILEAILWKPAVRWHIERIEVLAPIRFVAFRRNEVNSKAVAPARAVIDCGGPAPVLFADQDRAQRNTVALRDVDYVIQAHFTLTERAGVGDDVTKFLAMFNRRVAKGQHYHQPYFGCREFVAHVIPAADTPPPVPITQDIGIMLWDIEYAPEHNRPVFFQARLEGGVLPVPAGGVMLVSGAEPEGGAP